MVEHIRYWILGIFLGLFLFSACNASQPENLPSPNIEATSTRKIITPSVVETNPPPENTQTSLSLPASTKSPPTEEISSTNDQAEVLEVKISGQAGGYNYSVTIRSPEEGCSQYADWWEVISQDGDLLYRRILLHSHVNEQPFTRSGGPVPIEADTIVLVRAHMNTSGYGNQAMQGSFDGGFEQVELPPDFAGGLELAPPLPQGCNF
jgi:hypothetical protein